MKQLLKENAVLVAGVGLPLVLALVFFIAITAGRWGIEAPRTSVLFATGYSDHERNPVKISVRDGVAYLSYAPLPAAHPNHAYYDPYAALPVFKIFDPVTGHVRDVPVEPPPAKADAPKPFEIVVPVTEGHVLDAGPTSPDGFLFRAPGAYRNGNLMTEIFGGGRSRSDYVLEKGGYRMGVPGASVYNTHFVGWVVPE